MDGLLRTKLVLAVTLLLGAVVTVCGAEARERLDGYGDTKFGMNADEVSRALRGQLELKTTGDGGQKTYTGPGVRIQHLAFESRYIFDGSDKLYTVNLVHPQKEWSYDRCQRLFDEVMRMVSDRYGTPESGPKSARKPFERARGLVWTSSTAVARYDFGRDSGVAVWMRHHDWPRSAAVPELICQVMVQYGTASGGSQF
jgi:hypothetical protein